MNAPQLQVHHSNKALPPPLKDSLPPTPPQDHPLSFSPPPHLPPKSNPHYDYDPSSLSKGLRPPPAPIHIPAPDDFLDQSDPLRSFSTAAPHRAFFPLDPNGLNTGSGTPTSPASSDIRAKRTNPLVDLIDTEKLYIDQLTGIIRVGYPSHHLLEAVPVLMVDTESRFGMVALESPSPRPRPHVQKYRGRVQSRSLLTFRPCFRSHPCHFH